MDASIFDTFAQEAEWLGYGYLGARLRLTDEQRAKADAIVLAHFATRSDAGTKAGEDALFEWSNSRLGRWFGESFEGGYRSGRYLEYLPL
ncbi:hypothetical protein [Microbacterium sp. NPDC091662]|uniref:hypothetical protein n=1 Tax=Microbacterium sp. NPDC091662 TaxID=3364211 RepID=UPI00382E928B